MSALAERAALDVLHHDGIDITLEVVTPAEAQEMLRLNTANRKLRPTRVRQYARSMALSQFKLADQAIAFDGAGRLVQGQHRLAAVVESGVPLVTLVMRGLADDDKMNLDSGLVRKPADVLAWKGEKDVFNLASTVTFLWKHEQGETILRDSSVRPTAAEVVDWLERHPWVRDACATASNARKKVHIPQTALAVTYYLTRAESSEDADEFMALIASDVGHVEGSAILALRRWAQRVRDQAVGGGKPSGLVYAAVTLKAANAWREGRAIKIVGWRSGGAQAEQFPRVWVRP